MQHALDLLGPDAATRHKAVQHQAVRNGEQHDSHAGDIQVSADLARLLTFAQQPLDEAAEASV